MLAEFSAASSATSAKLAKDASIGPISSQMQTTGTTNLSRRNEMHSYVKDNINDGWFVLFYLPQVERDHMAYNVIKRFEHEQEAADYVSFLNGGRYPLT
jgi:hypothetical protein